MLAQDRVHVHSDVARSALQLPEPAIVAQASPTDVSKVRW